MPKFSYIARDTNGTLYKGAVDAVDKKEVRLILRQKGFYPTIIKNVRQWKKINLISSISSENVAIFAEQLSVMVDAGITLVRSLTTIAEQTKNEKFRQIINTTRQDVENGSSFADALKKNPKVFSNLFISLVKSGEEGGLLSKSLNQIAEYLENEKQIKRKVKSAFVYPKIVMGLCVIVVIFMVTFIVPKFMVIYNEMKVTLPMPTRIVIGISKFVPKYWWVVLLVTGALYFGYRQFKASKSGRYMIDKAGLYMPVFGNLTRKMVVSRFIKVLSALTASGVPIMNALDIARQVANNGVMDEVVVSIQDSVNAGGGIREPISKSDIFPPMVVQMVGLGEEVGSMGESLDKSSRFLDREIEDHVKRLIVKIEPATTIIIASVVGLILMAIYLPMFDMVKLATGK
ncbi:MAG: type II secretion system F family protein [Candidatus Poribacteria bacterium]